MATGENIAKIRKQRNWSQAKLAQSTGLSRSYIAEIEQGGREPGIGALARIAAALGVDVKQIIRGDK